MSNIMLIWKLLKRENMTINHEESLMCQEKLSNENWYEFSRALFEKEAGLSSVWLAFRSMMWSWGVGGESWFNGKFQLSTTFRV